MPHLQLPGEHNPILMWFYCQIYFLKHPLIKLLPYSKLFNGSPLSSIRQQSEVKKYLPNMDLLVFITLSILFPPLGMSCLGSILQLAPIHKDLKSFTLLKPPQTIISSSELHMNSHLRWLFWYLLCSVLWHLLYWVVTWCLMLIRLHLLQWFFLSPTTLCTVFNYIWVAGAYYN